MLAEALALGAEYVDVEWRARFDDLIAPTGGQRIVLSSHDFDGVPADLDERVARDAVDRRRGRQDRRRRPTSLSDCVPLLDLGARSGRGGGLVADRHGRARPRRRACSPRASARAGPTPGALDDIGQLSAGSAAERLPLPLDHRTRRASTASPAARWRTRCRRRCTTPRFAPRASTRSTCRCRRSSADDFVTFAARFGISGASVTIPLQGGAVRPRRRGRSRSRAASARSTRFASTTAAGSAATPTRPDSSSRCATACRCAACAPSVLGAGGAARAVAVALASSGARCGCTRATARRPKRSRGSRRSTSARGRRRRAAGICWSTARRSACIRTSTRRRCRRSR